MEVDIWQKIYQKNKEIATALSEKLREKEILCVNVLGSPGIGKTSCLIEIIKRLDFKSYVIEGDVEADFDTVKLQKLGINAVQIDTHGACHLDSPLIEIAVEELSPEKGILFIENIGNLICPAEFKIGEHIIVLIVSVTDGSDKPYKYPLAFQKADIIILNKCDLLPYVDFDFDFFSQGVRGNNKTAPIIKVSAKTGEGFEDIIKYLEKLC
ncbi:hydrogenase isoenzyme nickel incorporation protein [Clostridia bacterium]|nr:hydrogenase isoenzyme nickel incorporation protein [Clostridia bacterium]